MRKTKLYEGLLAGVILFSTLSNRGVYAYENNLNQSEVAIETDKENIVTSTEDVLEFLKEDGRLLKQNGHYEKNTLLEIGLPQSHWL